MMANIKKLEMADIKPLYEALKGTHVEKPTSLFEQYLNEMQEGSRVVWVAVDADESRLGYVTLLWQSLYPYFRQNNIPEINDLNVTPSARNQGVGSKLLFAAEKEASKQSNQVGLGVGLYADYGDAQHLYIKYGYVPDKHGATYHYQPVVPGKSYPVDDDLILWFMKGLSNHENA